VIACTKLILSLEKYLVDELRVLDLILGIIKKVMEQLNPLVVKLQFINQDKLCLSLLRIIINQIVELLEAGCTSYFAEPKVNDVGQAHTDLMGSNLPTLGFGFLNVTAGDGGILRWPLACSNQLQRTYGQL